MCEPWSLSCVGTVVWWALVFVLIITVNSAVFRVFDWLKENFHAPRWPK